MFEYRVTCASTIPPFNHDRHIYWLGGPGWSKAQSVVLNEIKYGGARYYTEVAGRRAYLHVAGDGDTEWVQTTPDYFLPNNLHRLPPCP